MDNVVDLIKGVDVVKAKEYSKVEFWVVDEYPFDRMTRNEIKDRPISLYKKIAEKVLRDLGISYTNLEWEWGDNPGFQIIGTVSNKLISVNIIEK